MTPGLTGARKKEFLLLLTITLKSQNFPYLGNEKITKLKSDFGFCSGQKEMKSYISMLLIGDGDGCRCFILFFSCVRKCHFAILMASLCFWTTIFYWIFEVA